MGERKGWRPDIAGLRGLAVLGVLLFHAVPSLLPGGFSGVDVFFVLSGYLMASAIGRGLRNGSFSFGGFYAARARRLFPALLATLCASLAAGGALLTAGDFAALAAMASAGAAFAGNLLAWSQSGYFGGEAAYKPLLHLWSLGVEEQFYLVFPGLLALLAARRANAPAWVGVLCFISFDACVLMTGLNPDAAFYSPLTRAWEPLLGAALALREEGNGPLLGHGALADRAFACACAGLALSFMLVGEQGFPGAKALVPAGSAALALASGGSRLSSILSLRPLAFMGRISYAAYLFHWPALVFARHALWGEPSAPAALGITAAACVAAWLFTALVEEPVRASRGGSRWLAAVAATALACGALAACSGTPSGEGRLARFENYPKESGDAFREREGCFVNLDDVRDFGASCVNPPGDGPLFALWGDSHAASMFVGLDAEARTRGARLAQVTASSCPPTTAPAGEGNRACAQMRGKGLAALRSMAPDTVILAARWTWGYDEALLLGGLRDAVRELRASGVRRVVVVGPLPVWRPSLPAAYSASLREGRSSPNLEFEGRGLLRTLPENDSLVRAAAESSGAEYVSPIETLCDKGVRACRALADPEHLMSFDDAHLTREGSAFLAARIAGRVFGQKR